ncbi:Repair protein Rad1/Rec1/Rad17 family protein [Cryptosporidium felis]|nr:Repair protein Rad1/Rec1/Rad17 family protein [Cryptosporidium felis]
MEAYLFDVSILIKTIQSLQLSKINKKGGEGQFLSCEISAKGIKLSNCTQGKDVYCCSWLKNDIFKKYRFNSDNNNNPKFEVCLNTFLNCIQVFGQDAKLVILTYDQVSLHLNITDDDGAVTDCNLCTYSIYDRSECLHEIYSMNRGDNSEQEMEYVIMFPNILRELIKDLYDIGRPEIEGEKCKWEFSDDHNVFSGSRILKPHCYFYSMKSLSQLEKSLNVCSLVRIRVNNDGLLSIQMAIKNDVQNQNREDDDEESNLDINRKKNQVFNTEFIILPINYMLS